VRRRSKWDDQGDGIAPAIGVHPGVTPAGAVGAGLPMGPAGTPQAMQPAAPSLADVKVLTIPARQKGGLIGIGGESIARIRQASGANIKIDHKDGDQVATITITGNIAVAEQLIQERLTEQYRDGWATKIMDVDPALVGALIGPGGSNLRNIFEATGCKIKFIQATEVDPTAPAGKQVASLRGPPERMHEGEEALLRSMQEVSQAPTWTAKGLPLGKGSGGFAGWSSDNPWAASSRMPPRGSKAIPCRFHLKMPGMCKNGDACPFSHDPAVIAAALGMPVNGPVRAPTMKTELCRYFLAGACARGASCAYAHGEEEMRLTSAQRRAGCGEKRSFSEAFQMPG